MPLYTSERLLKCASGLQKDEESDACCALAVGHPIGRAQRNFLARALSSRRLHCLFITLVPALSYAPSHKRDGTGLQNSNILKLMLALQSKIPLHVLRQAAGVSAGKEVLSPYEEEMFTTFDYDCTGEVPVSLCADLLTAIGRPVVRAPNKSGG